MKSSPYGDSAPRRLFAGQGQTSAARASDEASGLIHDVAFDETHGLAALDEVPLGTESGLPDRFEEVDLELERGEALSLFQRRRVGDAHRGICDVAKNPAVKRSH